MIDTPKSLLDKPVIYTEESYKAFIPVTTFRHLGVNDSLVDELTPKQATDVNLAFSGSSETYRHKLSEESPSQTLNIAWTISEGEDKSFILDLTNTDLTAEAGESVVDFKIQAAAHSTVNLYFVQRYSQQVASQLKLNLNAKDGAKANFIFLDLGAKSHQADVFVDLGEAAEIQIGAVYFAALDQIYDYNYLLRHHGEHSKSDLTVRGALKDHAQKTLRYTLDFMKGSHGSKGFEKEEVMLLSDGVYNASVPYLLSGEDDVEGTHAASVGRLDEASLFYLMSRGFPQAEAERMLILAQFSAILDRWPESELRNELTEILRSKVVEDV